MAADMCTATHAFDFSSTLRVTVNNIFGCPITLVLYTDSKFMFDFVVGLKYSTEKRFLIDFCMLRQCYKLCEMNEVKWSLSKMIPANTMTKLNASGALKILLEINKIYIDAQQWIERPSKKLQKRRTRDGLRLHHYS